ncbi:MAG: rhomboid family intramembrane serine protease [Candidatus Omnitrophica bacterium]|nr:rhomboid family intramembrane serine protease [Candidatus Omnitrophota bacterium]
MKLFSLEHVDVHLCEKCHGIWFDKDSFHAVLKFLEEDPTVLHDTYNPFTKKICVIDPKLYVRRNCPRCRKAMEQFNYAYDSNIFLDKCASCGGIWTDKGEILKAARHNKGYPKLEAIGNEMIKSAKNDETLKELSQLADDLSSSGTLAILMPKIILPLSDDTPRQRFPVVTLSIILLNIVAFIGEITAIGRGVDLTPLTVVPSAIAQGRNLYSLITAMFMHAGFLHLFFNMFFFWIFGDNVEDYLGHIRYLFLYLVFGICGGLLFTLTSLNTPLAAVSCVGASGAISGIVAAYFLIYPHAHVNILFFTKIIRAPAFLYIGWYIIMQIIFVGSKLATGYETVGYSAHLGGIISALIIVYLIKRLKEKTKTDNEEMAEIS